MHNLSMVSLTGNSGTGSTKAQQLKPPRGSLSPMELPAQNIVIGGQYPQQYLHSNYPILDPYASPNSKQGSPNLNSPFANLLHWSSGRSSSGSGGSWGSGSGSSGSGAGGHMSPIPLNSIENLEMPFSRSPTVFKTPVKMEEDVLVMDGIVVNSENYRKSKGSAGQKTRSPLSFSSSAGRLSFSSSSSSGKEDCCSYKMEKCRSWDDFGTCRFGSKCHFAHAMGELHAKNDLGNNKSECSPQEMICKPVGSRSCIDANMPQLDLHVTKASPLFWRSRAANIKSVGVGPVSPIEPECTTNNVYELNTWFPLDDGIQVSLPSVSSDHLSSSLAAVNAHVDSVLYGFSGRKRLSAFLEFCPN